MIDYFDGWHACVLGAAFRPNESDNWKLGWLTAQEFQL